MRYTLKARVTALAQELYDAFETQTRDNGERYYTLKDGSPSWMTDACHAAHGDMFPDDYRYEFICDAAEAIASADDPEDVEYPEPDIYTHDLIKWLGSRTDRYGYVDEATEEQGHGAGLIEDLQAGQAREKAEVMDQLRAALKERADEMDDDETDEDKDDDEPEDYDRDAYSNESTDDDP